MMLLAENCDQCIQTIIIDWLKTKTDMMKHVLTKFEQKDVLKNPQSSNQMVGSEKITSILGHNWSTYAKFIEGKEKKARHKSK